MIVTMHTTEEMIAIHLRNQGVPCKITARWNETVDGEIEIRPDLHIQVGYGHVCLVQSHNDETFEYHYRGNVMKALVTKLRRVMSH